MTQVNGMDTNTVIITDESSSYTEYSPLAVSSSLCVLHNYTVLRPVYLDMVCHDISLFKTSWINNDW